MKSLSLAFALRMCVAVGLAQGPAIIRVPTPIEPRCINYKADQVSISIRRVITQKTGDIITADKRAGVAVISTANSTTPGLQAKTPSVTLVGIQDEKKGRVSLAVEYPIAQGFALAETKSLFLELYLAKRREPNTFGEVLEMAGQVLGKLPIPANPYVTGVNRFLEFTNQSVKKQIEGQGGKQFATVLLEFNDREADIKACGEIHAFTGAIGVIGSAGGVDPKPLSTFNIKQNYCFRYGTDTTYVIEYQRMPQSRNCADATRDAWQEVPNDYVMIVISAQKLVDPDPSVKTTSSTEKLVRTGFVPSMKDLQQSKKLCESLKMPLSACGVYE